MNLNLINKDSGIFFFLITLTIILLSIPTIAYLQETRQNQDAILKTGSEVAQDEQIIQQVLPDTIGEEVKDLRDTHPLSIITRKAQELERRKLQ
jgi:hypothetical protein